MKQTPFPKRMLGDPEVAQLVMGQSPASETYNTDANGLPFYQGKTDFGLLYPRTRVWCSAPLRIAERHDTLVSVRAPVGDVNLAAERSCLGRGVAAIRPAQLVNCIFLFYAMAASKDRLAAVSTGTTFESINKTELEGLEIPFPELSEQTKIAAVLWKIQRAIEVEEKLTATSRELKQAATRQLFTHGLRGEAQQETEIGPIPESWHLVLLGSVCSLSTGTTPSTKNPAYYDGEVPFIKTFEVVNNRITKASNFVSSQAVSDYNLRIYPPGTVLMAMYGQGKTRGQVSLLEIPAATTQNAAAIEPGDRISGEFLWQYLLSIYEKLRGLGSLGHLSHLNLGYMRELAVICPSREEQDEVVAILNAIDRKISLHERKRAALQGLFQTLLHQLMTGKIRVADLDIDVSEVIA